MATHAHDVCSGLASLLALGSFLAFIAVAAALIGG
jgi:hypothetical protein